MDKNTFYTDKTQRTLLGAAESTYTMGVRSTPEGFSYVDGFIDERNGFKATVFKHEGTNEYIVSFAGTEKAQDAFADLTMGWNQWKDNKLDVLDYLQNVIPTDAPINFTGHSLGGALAQYAAYDFAMAFKGANPDDVPNITVASFNGIGAVGAINQYSGEPYDPSVMEGVPNAHWRQDGDIVTLMGTKHVGENTFILNNPSDPEKPLNAGTAHITSTLFAVVDVVGVLDPDFQGFTRADYDYFDLSTLQPIAAVLSNLSNNTEQGEVEAALRLTAGVLGTLNLAATGSEALGRGQFNQVMKVVFDDLARENPNSVSSIVNKGLSLLDWESIIANDATKAIAVGALGAAMFGDLVEKVIGASGGSSPMRDVNNIDLNDKSYRYDLDIGQWVESDNPGKPVFTYETMLLEKERDLRILENQRYDAIDARDQTDTAGDLAEETDGILDAISDAIGEIPDTIGNIINAITDSTAEIPATVGELINVIADAIGEIGENFGEVFDAIGGANTEFMDIIDEIIDAIGPTTSGGNATQDGFSELAQSDSNADGVIDSKDAVYAKMAGSDTEGENTTGADDAAANVNKNAEIGKTTTQLRDPLVLDLDGDGVEFTDLTESNAQFDLTQDGFATKTAWVSGDDGLLALDKNNDGKINDVGELFGSADRSGFSELSDYDSNSDGSIDGEDDVFEQLKVWQDKNGDGISQENELSSLADQNIQSISLDNTSVEHLDGDAVVTATGSFTRTDGSVGTVADVDLKTNDLYSRHTGDIATEVLDLPNIKGYGKLKDLHLAMSEDQDLAAQVRDIIVRGDTGDLVAAFEKILFKWAGVENIDAHEIDPFAQFFPDTETGMFNFQGSGVTINLSVQQLGAIKVYTGRDSLNLVDGSGIDLETNEGTYTGEAYKKAWDIMSKNLFAKFAVDSGMLNSVLPNISYDVNTDQIAVGLNPSSTEIHNLLVNAIFSGNEQTATNALLAELVLGEIDSAAMAIFTNIILDRGIYDIGDIAQNPLTSLVLKNIIIGNDETLTGTEGDDIIVGMRGNDTLIGNGGIDQIVGGAGNDMLAGGDGDDTYSFSQEDGKDSIDDHSEGNSIKFGPNITIADVSIILQTDEYGA